MNAIESLSKLFGSRKAEQEQKEKKISDLQDAITAMGAAAAVVGDVDEYMKHSEEKRRAEAQLYVLQRSKGDAAVTDEEAAAAWESFRADFEKKFNKAYSEYLKNRKALSAEYMELINSLNDALRMWEDLGAMIGIDEEKTHFSAGGGFDYDEVYLEFGLPRIQVMEPPRYLNYGSTNATDPDQVMFHADGLISDSDLDKIDSVIRLRHSY